MNVRNWKPGDAAVLTCEDETCPAREHPGLLAKSERWYLLDVGEYVDPHGAEPARPLVVIDPEDREQVERVAKRIGHLWKSRDYVADVVQAALREFANPKPEVYEHLAVHTEAGGLLALCGKVWKPNRDGVTVVGKCPECAEAAAEGWVA